MRRTFVSRAVVGLLLTAAIFSISAKCLENGGLQIGTDGKWHLYGEIHNETDVQGLEMALRGEVYDVEGELLAAGDAIMCPKSLSPGTFSVYDILVDTPGAIADHRVNVASGQASDNVLPPLEGTFSTFDTSFRYNTTTQMYELGLSGHFDLAEPPSNPAAFTYCIALYNAAGRVIGLFPYLQVISSSRLIFKTTDSNPITVPGDVVTMRFIVWRGTPTTSLTAPAISDPIVISP